MKGGKEGRKPKSAGTAGRPSGERGKPKKAATKRPASTAPKKGSRKNPGYGWTSSTGE